MKKLLDYADDYIRECNWKDLTQIKICLCAAGVMIGLCVPKEKKKVPFLIAAGIFLIIFIPLMTKLIRAISLQKKHENA